MASQTATAVHPYRQHAHNQSQEVFQPSPFSSGPTTLNKQQLALVQKLNSSSTSSGNTYHSAQTVARVDTNQSIINNNSVDSTDLINQQKQQDIQSAYFPPPPTLQSTNASPRNSNESPRNFVHHRSDSSLSAGISDTPIGSRSFSLPLQGQSKSTENLDSSRSQSPSSNNDNRSGLRKTHDRSSKSIDLSHLYLLDRDESTHFTLTNESLSDDSHNLIKQYLGENSSSSLLPRMKTIEMYRKNVKKSNDPKVLFQYAQYMLQTALTIDTKSTKDDENLEKNVKKQFLKEAIHYLKKLADKGYTDAQYLLGDAYSSGALGKVDNKEAFSLFQGAAKHGHIESAYRTAYCYEEGLGVSRDSRRAIEFLKYAASKNHPAAMYKLGIYSFYSRMGLPDNINMKRSGIQWLTRAVSSANELTNSAPYELAKIQQDGFLDIVIPDLKYAMELYVQAASLGHVKSAAILGKAYELGNEVVQPDSDLSIHYYTQAAIGGDAESMLSLCAWYLVGNPPNLPKDESEAFQWALKAANMNLSKAQFAVGHFYEKGMGCDHDINLAKEWYKKAEINGDERAKNKLLRLTGVVPTSGSDNPAPSSRKLSNKKSAASLSFPINDKKLNKKKSGALKEKKEKKDKDCIIM